MFLSNGTSSRKIFLSSIFKIEILRVQYATKMMKLDRRGYKQHLRILCITTERIYNITKKKPYPKEAVLFNDILGLYGKKRWTGLYTYTRNTR